MTAQDVYICPSGQQLMPRYKTKVRDTATIEYCNRAACRACDLRNRCTKGSYRRISRYENEAVLERMADRPAKRPAILDQRRCSLEHPFGSIEQWMNQGAFLMKRLDKVRGEFRLTALVYNIRRAIDLVGVSALMAAARP